MKSVWKQPYFVFGFIILAFFLIGSFVFEWINGPDPKQTFFIYEKGKLVEAAPLSPSWANPFGTDQFGYDMFAKIMLGAKYTIIAAMGVAAVRMFIAVPLGFVIGTYWQKKRSLLNSFIDPLHYVPMTIFSYLMLFPVLWEPMEGFSTTVWERIVIQVVLMAIITVPIVSALIGNEANLLYQQEYILAARTLGASRRRIITRHLFPMMREKLFVLYGQQVVETLVVFTHLGLLQLFIGGTNVSYDPMFGDPPKSIAYEWAGLFGSSFRYLQGVPWLPLAPAICFALVILAVATMIEGYTRAVSGQVIIPKRRKAVFVSDDTIEWNQRQLKEKLRLLHQTEKQKSTKL
ncbi:MULTISPECIES: ABC transporter permease [Bacillaceae]|uniref:ABC transporter permease n=1 Tax=Bacillaceae TaxID=186817 RepID=UPI0006AE136C|nr:MULTISPECIES: ABC transporter permease subunit [Bacillaceae]ALC85065.1 peptide ABC transporter permease [Bacillus sp. FJAT-22090]KQL34327.1 peptide ABC transporter permease [Psychrobacillus sp. FJAT-21963]